jgi:protein TonB
MIARYASAVTTGTFMTFGLLFIMQLLISLQPGAESVPRERHYLNPFKVEPAKTKLDPIEELPPRENLTKTELPPPRPLHGAGHGTIGVRLTEPGTPRLSGGIPGPDMYSDGPLVALVRVSPVYPARALSQGLEGTVIVQFDVSAKGQVVNIVVIESSHRIFEQAAIQAAERFRFKPRVIDGIALETYGIQNLFRFSLDDQ